MSAATDATGETVTTPSRALPRFLPVRMLNDFTHCARLGYLESVQREFTDDDDTIEGRYHHRNVDRDATPGRREDDGDSKSARLASRSNTAGEQTTVFWGE
jgi:hypothetical protein